MNHTTTIDKENKVLILKVSIPRKKRHRDPDMRVYTEDAWEMVKDIKIDGFEILPHGPGYKPCRLDNYSLFHFEGEFVFPLKELAKPEPKFKQKSTSGIAKSTRTVKKSTKTKSKAKDAEE